MAPRRLDPGSEPSLDDMVQIDLEGVPLRTTLRLALSQIDFTYRVADGVLHIVPGVEDHTDGPAYLDPFLTGGQCVLAWLAAGLGGLAGYCVSGPTRRPDAA